jgi:hypothetical protein
LLANTDSLPDFAAGDQWGPCPGLNALANHGYIDRNGVTSVSLHQLIMMTQTYEISSSLKPRRQSTKFGEWGLDLGGILAVMGAVFVDNPLSLDPRFSISGETGSVENILGTSLGY